MTTGLPTSRLIKASWSLTAAAASYANINTLLILGDSDVIDVTERMRTYEGAADVAADFGTSAPEYAAALIFFSQKPAPASLFIGRWARTATAGLLKGAILTSAQQALSNFTAVTSGGFKIAVDGASSPVNVSGINLSAATSLSNVATIISAALTSASVGATCTWDGTRFVFKSATTVTSSAVAFLTAPNSGTSLAGLLGGLSTSGGYVVAGIAAETALAAVTLFDDLPTYWWGLMFAASTMPNDSDHQAIAAYIETGIHAYGITVSATTAIDGNSSADIGSLLKQAGYQRTFGIYLTTSPYAVAGIFGSLLTTDFSGSNTMPTVAWKTIIGIAAESLRSSQANALDNKRYNYFATFDNEASITVNGTCFGDAYLDEIYGLDWLVNRVQTDQFNKLAASPKVAQTDRGLTELQTVMAASLGVGVTNGLIGEGLTWQAAGFGSLKEGDVLPKGFYIYIPRLSSQSAADRKKRVTPPIQVAVKLAGAVHSVDALLTINR